MSRSSLFNIIFTLLLAIIAHDASAAPAPVPSDATLDSIVSLDEVSVSAIKATSVRVFPSSSTTLDLKAIDRYDIDGIKQISEIAPNFFMPAYGSRMTSSIYVRGLGTRIDQPIVSLNVDNVPMMNKDAFDFSLPDIDRVEMVRGPQGILYGRNTMGGVINLSTISPLRYQGVRAMLEYSSGNSWKSYLGVYQRLSSTVGLAVVGAYNHSDGFYRNAFTGKKIDNERQGLGKIKLSWRPSDSFLLENSAWATVTRQGGYPYQSVETGLVNHNDTCFYRRLSVIDGLTMRYLGDDLSVSSITGFQYLKDNMTLDQDFLPQDYFTLSQRRHEWSMTQDFVVKGHRAEYRYLFGAFAFYKRADMQAPVTFKDYGIATLIENNINSLLPQGMTLRWDSRQMILASDFVLPSWGWALYHKSEYRIGRWNFTGGLRLAFERRSIDYLSAVNTSATMYLNRGGVEVPLATRAIDIALADKLHQTSLQLLPEVKIAYDITDEIALGAIFSKGHKAGGYNTQMFSDILQQQMMSSSMGTGGHADGDPATPSQPAYDVDRVISYKPEISWNYEINFAAALLDRRLSLDASAFLISCRDQQMTVFPEGSTTGRYMTNAGRTRSIGFELTANYVPSTLWRFSGSYGLADARFRKYQTYVRVDGAMTPVNCRGNRVPYAPLNTMFLAASYSPSFSFHGLRGLEATLSCRGVGPIQWNEENTLRQRFYALLSLSVTLKTQLLDIDLWADNMTRARYSTFYFESIGNQFLQRGTPRRFGITLRFALDRQ